MTSFEHDVRVVTSQLPQMPERRPRNVKKRPQRHPRGLFQNFFRLKPGPDPNEYSGKV